MIPHVSPEAEKDLDEMETWLVQNWGPLAAANVIEGVLAKIARLAEMPLSGTPRVEFGKHVRFVTAKRYVIYYEASAGGLTVLRVLHSARDRASIMRRAIDEGEDTP